MISGFPKIFTLGDRFTQDILKGVVEITEKVDGSQFNFGRIGGIVQMRSKNAAIFHEDGNKMFNKAKEFVAKKADLLPKYWVFHGEYLQTPKHNTLHYDRVPHNNFALFGITINGEPQLYYKLLEWSKVLECDVVPLIYEGELDKLNIDEYIDRVSFLGGAKIEGIVLKNYTQQVMIGSQIIPLLAGKFVTEQFKEKHKVNWGVSNPHQGDRIQKIICAYKTEARWSKAIQHLRDDGTLTESPKDIGPLLKEIQSDVLNECTDEIKDYLFKAFKDDVLRGLISGFPEFYKRYIAERINEG